MPSRVRAGIEGSLGVVHLGIERDPNLSDWSGLLGPRGTAGARCSAHR